MSDWISVKDRLPPQDKNLDLWIYPGVRMTDMVLEEVWEDGKYYTDWVACDGSCPIEDHSLITHWMPLPAPPESEANNAE